MKRIIRIASAMPFNEVWLGRRKVMHSDSPILSVSFDTPIIQEDGVELSVRMVLQPKHLSVMSVDC